MGYSRTRRAARTDDNHGPIVAALRAAGCSVHDLSRVGNGFPDLLVARNGFTLLMEVKADIVNERKDGYARVARGELNPAQVRFRDEWRGRVEVVRTVDEALRAVQAAPKGEQGEVR